MGEWLPMSGREADRLGAIQAAAQIFRKRQLTFYWSDREGRMESVPRSPVLLYCGAP